MSILDFLLPPVECARTDAEDRDAFNQQLRASLDVAAIARILNGRDRKAAGLPNCELTDLPLADARRYRELAEIAIALTDAFKVEEAYQAAAVALCEGHEEEYAPWTHQGPRVQAILREHAKHIVQTFLDTLTND